MQVETNSSQRRLGVRSEGFACAVRQQLLLCYTPDKATGDHIVMMSRYMLIEVTHTGHA